MPKKLIVGLALVLACGGSSAATPASTTAATTTTVATPSVDHVDGPAAKDLVKKGAILVDVRSPEEFAEKHIEGAINVPLDSIASHDFGGKDKSLVLYCRSGHRSGQAADVLKANGYTNVHLLGAMSAWGD